MSGHLFVRILEPQLSSSSFQRNLPRLDKHASLTLAHVQNTFRRPEMHLALLLLVFLRA